MTAVDVADARPSVRPTRVGFSRVMPYRVEAEFPDDTNKGSALLHDAIEDQEVPFELIVREFGKKVADLVLEVSDDKALASRHEGNPRGRSIYQIADICAKMPPFGVRWRETYAVGGLQRGHSQNGTSMIDRRDAVLSSRKTEYSSVHGIILLERITESGAPKLAPRNFGAWARYLEY